MHVVYFGSAFSICYLSSDLCLLLSDTRTFEYRGFKVILLVISDVHGNYHALDHVMKEVEYDALACCGDIVVDYPFPQQCIRALKDSCARIC